MASTSREDCIYFARLAEQGERYDDMIKNMKLVANVSSTVHQSNAGWSLTLKRRKKFAFCCLQKLSWSKESCLENY